MLGKNVISKVDGTKKTWLKSMVGGPIVIARRSECNDGTAVAISMVGMHVIATLRSQ